MIKRRALLAGAAASAAAGAALAATGAQRKTFTAVDVHPNDYPTVQAVHWIGEQLEHATDGRLSIRIYPGGQLGAETDTVALTRFHVLDICRVTTAALNNAFPLTQALTLPFLYRDEAHVRAVTDGDIGREILAAFEQRGLIGLCFYDGGMRSMYNVRHPIHEPSDMRGLKVRVPRSDVLIEALSEMGANPTPIPLGDVFTGLQTHLLDGAENNWATFQSAHHYEVAHYWSNTQHGCSPEALLLSKASFEALSASDRELVLATARASVPVMRALWETKQETARQTALAGGAIANEVNRAAFEAHVAPMRRRYEQNAQIGGLIRRIQARS